jgi:phage tail sheath protein FI
MPIFDVPGVQIDEITSPGVIAGVGTSTAAFVGPALAGPLNQPTRISSFDEFLQQFGLLQPNGTFMPYIFAPRTFYLAHGVRSFFDNGGRQAYIVRVGTAVTAEWDIKNQKTPTAEVAFRLQAQQQGIAGNNIKVQVNAASATGAGGKAVATASTTATTVNGTNLVVADASNFRVGDIVTKVAATENLNARAGILSIQGQNVTLSNVVTGLGNGDQIRIASIVPAQATFRMAATSGISPGAIAVIKGDDFNNPGTTVQETVLVQIVDPAGFVTVSPNPARSKTYNLGAATAPVLISEEFQLVITPPRGPAETWNNLSLIATHPGYVFAAVNSSLVNVLPPIVPTSATVPQSLVKTPVTLSTPDVLGVDDDLGSISVSNFQTGLDALKDIEDVNIVVIPDAASTDAISIQQAMIAHCLIKRDRFAVLDSKMGAAISGPGSVAEQRLSVQSDHGFAALYYPWLTVKDPTSSGPIPRNMLIPPSGAIAGIYARTDSERGVHKAPANTDVRGILGLERILSDGQQGPLNLAGVDVLRIFPGTAQALVWGARTTGDPQITDWVYVNVRRLMIYIEQSIESGIRWAVFEPNGLPLWQKLKRTLNEFLTRVWRDGALFGATADKAFYVRIDEALNPPATRALGRLYIEIGVAPVRPAEFIVVRIGLWDGGAQISE